MNEINKLAVFHQAKSNDCYISTKDYVHIRLKSAKNDLDKVVLVYGDKYDWSRRMEVEMNKTFRDSDYDYFEAKVTLDSKRLSYYFELYKDEKLYNFTNFGFLDEVVHSEAYLFVFHYPYIHNEEMNETPEWVRDAMFYQIFPDRFEIGNPEFKDHVNAKWNDTPRADSFHGGDIQGVIKKLDYLEELGINAIYFTPIFKSPTNHKYDTIDYMELDPHFGTKEDFKELVEKAHAKGMKIILDAVFNHTSEQFFAFKDILEKQEKSEYLDWYYVNKFPIDFDMLDARQREKGWIDWHLDEKTGENLLNYECFAFCHTMPKINLCHPDVQAYLLKAVAYWTREFEIDGWRLDVSDEAAQFFWKEFRKTVKSINPDAYIVGELWANASPWLSGDQFDSVMNYGVTYLCTQYFAQDRISPVNFMENISKLLMSYQNQTNEVMLNLLDSHDTARFLNQCDHDENKHLLALTFILSYIGAPMIYYGTEVGMDGEHDPHCRKGMEWNEENWNMKYYDKIKKLIDIRQNNIELRRGKFIPHYREDVVMFEREYEGNSILVALNNSDKELKLDLDEKYHNSRELTTELVVSNYITLPPMQAVIVKK